MRRSSRAPSGNSSDKVSWTVEFSGTSPNEASVGSLKRHESRRARGRQAPRNALRRDSQSPTAADRSYRPGRQPPALANSPVLQAALAEYSRGASAHTGGKCAIIAPGPFGGPQSPPTHHNFRTMQVSSAASSEVAATLMAATDAHAPVAALKTRPACILCCVTSDHTMFPAIGMHRQACNSSLILSCCSRSPCVHR